MLMKKTMRKVAMATGLVTMAATASTAFLPAKANVPGGGGGGGEKGPSVLVDCAGWGTGDKTVCNATNDISCTPHGCA